MVDFSQKALVGVCGRCQRYLGPTGPHPDVQVTYGVCLTCLAREKWADSPTLVISRSKAALLPVLQDLLSGTPQIRVLIDRRAGERRHTPAPVAISEDRRRGPDRRRGAPMLLA